MSEAEADATVLAIAAGWVHQAAMCNVRPSVRGELLWFGDALAQLSKLSLERLHPRD